MVNSRSVVESVTIIDIPTREQLTKNANAIIGMRIQSRIKCQMDSCWLYNFTKIDWVKPMLNIFTVTRHFHCLMCIGYFVVKASIQLLWPFVWWEQLFLIQQHTSWPNATHTLVQISTCLATIFFEWYPPQWLCWLHDYPLADIPWTWQRWGWTLKAGQ